MTRHADTYDFTGDRSEAVKVRVGLAAHADGGRDRCVAGDGSGVAAIGSGQTLNLQLVRSGSVQKRINNFNGI